MAEIDRRLAGIGLFFGQEGRLTVPLRGRGHNFGVHIGQICARRLSQPDGVDGPVDALLADRPGSTELLGPQADPQFLDHPCDIADIGGCRPGRRKRQPELVVGVLYGVHAPHPFAVGIDAVRQSVQPPADGGEIARQVGEVGGPGGGDKAAGQELSQAASGRRRSPRPARAAGCGGQCELAPRARRRVPSRRARRRRAWSAPARRPPGPAARRTRPASTPARAPVLPPRRRRSRRAVPTVSRPDCRRARVARGEPAPARQP